MGLLVSKTQGGIEMKKCESCGGTGYIAVCSCERRNPEPNCDHECCNQYCGCDLGGNPVFIAQEESK